ncbi:MAG: hypothetical protein AB7E42_02805 [Anaerotignaceae bacterium]
MGLLIRGLFMEIIEETAATMTNDMASRVPTEFVPFVFVLLVLLIFVCIIVRDMQKVHKSSIKEIREAYNSSMQFNQKTIEDLRATIKNERAEREREKEYYRKIGLSTLICTEII